MLSFKEILCQVFIEIYSKQTYILHTCITNHFFLECNNNWKLDVQQGLLSKSSTLILFFAKIKMLEICVAQIISIDISFTEKEHQSN